MKKLPILAAATASALILAAAPGHAQYGSSATPPPQSNMSRADMTDGEVRRVDRIKGTVLIKHSEIKNIGMAPMTMGFKLQDPRMAEGLNPGDKIKFTAIQKGDELIVTHLLKVQ